MVAAGYLLGVSTRRMHKLLQSLGITSLTKPLVGEMAQELDGHRAILGVQVTTSQNGAGGWASSAT
ncbi:MAG: hypothetical protein JWN91_627 [Nocardioides sp.]|nr:hypothetical protein [Nocardioides sp.]